MPAQRRTLAAIMFTDIVGYTALMGESEERALAARRRHGAVVPDLVRRCGGEPVHDRGDETLSTFSTALDAVRCALAIQESVAGDDDLNLRIGIHLGDTIFEDGDVTGDGVNIAARIRPLADPGTVCVSEEVWNAVRNHDGIEARALGEHELRNVGRPITVYSVSSAGWSADRDDKAAAATGDRLADLGERAPEKVEPDRFVGRARELAELQAGIDDVQAGRGRLFFIAGEPGIGKTRLAEEAATKAAAVGAHVIWGRAWESEGAPPYWLWVQILRGLAADADRDTLRSRVAVGLPYLAQLLPELTEPSGDTGSPAARKADESSGDSARQRFELFDAVTRFIVVSAADRPLVLVLDDLQWADAPSLLLLRFFAREIRMAPVMILGTWRDVEARVQQQVGEILSSVAREGQVIHLGGLSEAEVGRLVARRNRDQASDELVANVHRRTRGNPFFVDGILRLLPPDSAGSPSGRLPIPDEVRDAIRRRLEPMSPGHRELLTAAAILGREFDAAALAAVSETRLESIVARLEEAARLEIISPIESHRRWRFTHDLFREVLYEDLSVAERSDGHHRTGRALETFYGDDRDAHAAELATHFSLALPGGDPERAMAYGMLAARNAMSSYAWEDAVRELERVIGNLPMVSSASDRDRVSLLLFLGEAVYRSDDPKRFRDIFRDALTLARDLSLPHEFARAVLGYVGFPDMTTARQVERVELVEEALTLLGEADLVLRSRLLAWRWWQTYFSADWDSKAMAEECIDVARRSGDRRQLVNAFQIRHTALLGFPEELAKRLESSDEMLEVARTTGAPVAMHVTRRVRVMDRFETGDVSGLDAELSAYCQGAKETREPAEIWHSAYLRASRILITGDWETAEQAIREAREIGRVTINENSATMYAAQMHQLRYDRGTIADAIPRLIQAGPHLYVRALRAMAWAELGREAEARTDLEALRANGIRRMLMTYPLPGVLAEFSVAAAFLEDTTRAEPLYERLLPFSGLNLFGGWAGAFHGTADHFLGLLARTLGRWDDSIRHFEGAVEMHRRMGARPALARTQYEYALARLRRGEPDDAANAAALLRDAVDGARALGMATLLPRAERELASVQGADVDDRDERSPDGSGSGPTIASDRADRTATLRREGDYWTIGWNGSSFRLRDLKGLTYIQRLITEAGRELHCTDVLADGESGTTATGGGATAAAAIDTGDAGEILDAEAKAAYRRRLDDLRDELAEAESNGDPGRAAKAREEIDAITQELSAAVGLGGRDRRAARNVERARIRVTRAIRDAIARIRKHDEALGHHLSTAIKTGAFCSYTPDPNAPVTWES